MSSSIERRLAALENAGADAEATGLGVLVLPAGLSAEDQEARVAERLAALPAGGVLYVLPDNERDPKP